MFIYIDTDIDECENTTSNDCKQVCINTEGSYYCECLNGFKFIAGSTTDCEGEIKTFLVSKVKWGNSVTNFRAISETPHAELRINYFVILLPAVIKD